MGRQKILSLFLIPLILFSFSVFSQNPPSTQTSGGLIQQQKQIIQNKDLEKKVKQEKDTTEPKVTSDAVEEDEGEKILVTKITVEGVTLVKQSSVDKIVNTYQGKELSLKGMQKVADLITDVYRQKGYATSRAYIPPQTISGGILIIRVIEGSLGQLEIKGNRYFKTALLERRLRLKPGVPFDYSKLQESLTYINEHPDRNAKVVLVPGAKPGTTDVIVEVTDNFPVHRGYEYDNYNSQFLDKDRWSAIVEHNNLLGFDDKIYVKISRSEGDWYRLQTARYILPLSNSLELGFYAAHNKTKLGREFEVIDSRGLARVYGAYLTKALITKPDIDFRLNLGFDYKDIKNYLLTVLNTHDELRVAKGGFDLDVSDKWGRTIFTAELDAGIPSIMGGMPGKTTALMVPGASREGAGGRFYKGVFNLYRFQPGPFGSFLLFKNQAQYSAYNLVAAEEFQIGGPTSVRGYPPAEHAGDKGYYGSCEWSFPPYLVPKWVKIPYIGDRVYDALHFVAFFDWATVHLNKPMGTEEKHQTLRGWGYGARLNLSNDLSARIEFGMPLADRSSDNKQLQQWIEVTWKF